MNMMKLWLGFVNFLLVLLMVLPFCRAASSSLPPPTGYQFPEVQMDAMRSLRSSWSETPDKDRTLKGWSSDSIPCLSRGSNWRGVDCARISSFDLNASATDSTFHILVVALTLSDVDVRGQLPAAIGNLSTLVSMVLTGNRGLNGPIPKELAKLNFSLSTLDLHGNALSGDIFNEIYHFNHLQILDLSDNKLTGKLPNSSTLSSLRTISFAGNQLEDDIPKDMWILFRQMEYLVTLDLSNNNFSGAIPIYYFAETKSSMKFLNLSMNHFTFFDILVPERLNGTLSGIQVLDLSSNKLGGPATSLLVSLLNASGSWSQEIYLDNNNFNETLDMDVIKWHNTSLSLISLTNNNIADVRYSEDFYVNYLKSPDFKVRLAGNPFCNTKQAQGVQCFCLQACPLPGMRSTTDVLKVSLSASLSSSLAVILVAAFLFRRSQRQHKQFLRLVQQKFEEHDVKPTLFTYNELRSATHDFHLDMKLGEGAYGAVFKGVLPNKNVVAVKQLHINSQQGLDEFLNEVVLISGMKHRNLVKLKGCCIREKQRLLVYEYIDNHDIQWVLLEGKSDQTLSWPKRMRVCLGIAHGLHYLHALAQPKIIHRDIKPANILLDSNLEPKIADFGLALLFPEETTHIMTLHVAGTKGYLAPEYATVGQLSEKADVFSFGVVCLEIVSGRKCLDNSAPPEQAILTTWAQERHSKGSIMDIVDPKMELRSDEVVEVQQVLNTALLCLQHRANRRPDMAHAVSMLQGELSSEVMGLGTDSERSLGSIDYDASSSMQMSLRGLRATSTDQDVLKSERLPSRSQGYPTIRSLKRSDSIQINVA